jgi:hypothetical protein
MTQDGSMFAGNLEDAIEKFAFSGDLPTRKLRILPYRAPLLGGDFWNVEVIQF